jgi:hypothetical protein
LLNPKFICLLFLRHRLHADSCGLDEGKYFTCWFDDDYWRTEYFDHVNQHSIHSPDSLWTFDIIHFPYTPATSLLRPPEKDYERRPRNLKPRISVIFAFNASGDYTQPFFVYPLNFSEEDAEPSTAGADPQQV